MVTSVVTLLVVAAVVVIAHRFAPKPGERAEPPKWYRPHALVADWSPSYRDERRQLADLAAIRARREPDGSRARAVPGTPTPARSGKPARAVRGSRHREVQF
jgi:hypothetical protein